MPDKRSYHIKLVEKIESVQQRTWSKTWKEQSATKASKETYVFKSRLFPKQCNKLENIRERSIEHGKNG